MPAWQETKTWSIILTAISPIWLIGCQPSAQGVPESEVQAAAPAIQGEVAQASYGMGYMIASNMVEQFAGSLDQEALIAGLNDRFADRERQVSEAQAQSALAALARKQAESMQAKSGDNLSVGGKFLADNGNRDGVTTTPSGLQYEVLVGGDGAKPGPTDTVTTHYHGTFIDGNVFDSSVDRGQPLSFPVNGVIGGWTEALQLMAVGSKWRLFIPPELAYGSQGGPGIPANSTLVFEVELLSIGDAN